MTFKRIVCGVDFSPLSVMAFATAVELARAVNAELHVLHVIETIPQGNGAEALSLEQKATAAMDALVTKWATVADTLHVTTEITTGVAGDELVNRVRDSADDVLVVGARGVTLLEDAFFGSTAARLVKEAPCSVLVVRNQAPNSRGA
jgi:universal stress protein A